MAASVAFALPFVYSATARPDTRTNNLCHHAKSLMQNVANKKFSVSNLCQNPKQSIQLINSFKFPIDFSSGTRPWTVHAFSASATSTSPSAEKTLYDYTVKDIDGNDVPLSKFKGKVLLVVNVASKCGLTGSNYTELSHLYEKYNTQGFEILAFPCNQFGGQEPGKNSEIKQFANTKFKAEFPIFDKVDVNGPQTAPVYNFLKSSKGGGLLGDGIKWNFEKFLVDKNGKVVERYLPTTSPFQIEKDIQKLLAA